MPVMQYIHADKHYPVTLKVFPGSSGAAAFQLYEDDGTTNDYKKNIASRTDVSYESDDKHVRFTIDIRETGGYQGDVRNYIVEIPAAGKPRSVTINGEKMKSGKPAKLTESLNREFGLTMWSYDRQSQKVSLRIPNTIRQDRCTKRKDCGFR